MLVSNTTKTYEKPSTGDYIGVLADVVDLGTVQGKFGAKPMVRLVWLLNKKDKEGNYYRAMAQVNASMNEKAKLYELVRGILNSAPPVPYELENLIGRQNRLIIVLEEGENKKPFASIKAILPVPEGTETFTVPKEFTRNKDRQNTQTKPANTNAALNTSATNATTAVASTETEEVEF